MKKTVNSTRLTKKNLSNSNSSTRFTGAENHHISLEEAAVLTKTYRATHPNQTIAHFFGKQTIQAILNQSNCVGIRIYYGVDPRTGEKHPVVVGADPDKNDICHGYIAERAMACPSHCGKPSPLNS